MKDVTRLANGIALIEQRKLDEMNNHIAELHSIIEHNFEKLPYEVQKQLGGYIWSNYEEQQKQKEMPSDWSLGLE